MSVKRFLDSIGSRYKRVFILYSTTAVTAPIFTCKTLATRGGRMDVVIRAAIYALCDATPCRKDTLYIAHLGGPPRPPRQLFLDKNCLGKSLGEKEVCRIILEKLSKSNSYYSFLELIGELAERAEIITMHERGRDIVDVNWSTLIQRPLVFVVGDHRGFPPNEENYLLKHTLPLSIGSTPYLASHVVAYVNEVIDRVARLYV